MSVERAHTIRKYQCGTLSAYYSTVTQLFNAQACVCVCVCLQVLERDQPHTTRCRDAHQNKFFKSHEVCL